MTETIRVNDVYPTIQGEGVHTGVPMALIRLHGCSVGCPWCDTRETWDAIEGHRRPTLEALMGNQAPAAWAGATPLEIASLARTLAPGLEWALVTGGEPAEQSLGTLVRALHGVGFRAALETSGTATGHVGAGFDWVCCSPKVGMPGGRPILREAVAPAHEIKFVIGARRDVEAAERFLAEHRGAIRPDTAICLQPLSESRKATELCISECLNRGWRLSLQSHKAMGVR